jgi:signal transduction histidine kinase
MREMLFYALTSALTCIPYAYSVHYSLTPKKKTLKSLLLYSLLICVLLWIKLFFDARYKASLATILITNFSLFATMKIFTKDSWARVFKFYLILTTGVIISELFSAVVFFSIGISFENVSANLPSLPVRFFSTISLLIFSFIGIYVWNKISKIEMNTKLWEFFAVLAVQMVICGLFLIRLSEYGKTVKMLHVVIYVGAAWVLTDGFFIKAIYDNQQKAELKMSLDQAMQLEKMQYEYYENLTESVYSMRKFRHDMNNTLQTLSVMMNDPDSPESRENGRQLFEQMQEKYKQTQIPYYSSNPVINAVILSKSLAAEENGVKLTVSVNGENLDDIENIDLCSIFSNLLDNALEAARNIRDGEIELSSWSEAGYFFIKCVNSYAGKSSLVNKER